jgi:hypothetical protein
MPARLFILNDSPGHIPQPVLRHLRVRHRADEHVEILDPTGRTLFSGCRSASRRILSSNPA